MICGASSALFLAELMGLKRFLSVALDQNFYASNDCKEYKCRPVKLLSHCSCHRQVKYAASLVQWSCNGKRWQKKLYGYGRLFCVVICNFVAWNTVLAEFPTNGMSRPAQIILKSLLQYVRLKSLPSEFLQKHDPSTLPPSRKKK